MIDFLCTYQNIFTIFVSVEKWSMYVSLNEKKTFLVNFYTWIWLFFVIVCECGLYFRICVDFFSSAKNWFLIVVKSKKKRKTKFLLSFCRMLLFPGCWNDTRRKQNVKPSPKIKRTKKSNKKKKPPFFLFLFN